jgi:hypothetical protein
MLAFRSRGLGAKLRAPEEGAAMEKDIERQFRRANTTVDRTADAIISKIDHLVRDHCQGIVEPSYLIERLLLTLIARPGFLDAIDLLAKVGGGDASMKLHNALLDYRDSLWVER